MEYGPFNISKDTRMLVSALTPDLARSLMSYLPSYPIELFHLDGTEWLTRPEFKASELAQAHAIKMFLTYSASGLAQITAGDYMLFAGLNNITLANKSGFSHEDSSYLGAELKEISGIMYDLQSLYYPDTTGIVGDITVAPMNKHFEVLSLFLKFLFSQSEIVEFTLISGDKVDFKLGHTIAPSTSAPTSTVTTS